MFSNVVHYSDKICPQEAASNETFALLCEVLCTQDPVILSPSHTPQTKALKMALLHYRKQLLPIAGWEWITIPLK